MHSESRVSLPNTFMQQEEETLLSAECISSLRAPIPQGEGEEQKQHHHRATAAVGPAVVLPTNTLRNIGLYGTICCGRKEDSGNVLVRRMTSVTFC